jgi:hypothetical protein
MIATSTSGLAPGEVSKEGKQLCKVTKNALDEATRPFFAYLTGHVCG